MHNIPFKKQPYKANGPHFTLQWHLTATCLQDCMHCYMKEEDTYTNEIRHELKYEQIVSVIDDFYQSFSNVGMAVKINFTGGDPLLKDRFIDILNYTSSKKIGIGILGNPNLLDRDTAILLKNIGVTRYQLSIDGLEKTHDKLRGKVGLFKDTIRAVRILNDVGIPTVIMFTLSRLNANELIKVIKFVANENVSIFDFARIVPVGSGRQMINDMISPKEYRKLLLNVFNCYKELKDKGCRTLFGRKDNLWKLLYKELGLLKPLPDDGLIYGGCGIGNSILTILADGTVYSCRRLPIKIGKVPEENLFEVFVNSKEQNEMRKIENHKKCLRCELLRQCRGCPAVSYSVTGDFFEADPQCWKQLN